MKKLTKAEKDALLVQMDNETSWGKAWKDILTCAFEGKSDVPSIKQNGKLRGQTYLSAVRECASAFHRVAGQSYSEFLGLHFANTLYDGNKMATYQLSSLRRIVDIAWKNLNPNEFSVITARALYRAPEKLSFEQIAEKTGLSLEHSVKRQLFYKGKEKLLAAIEEQAPDLAGHPFLTHKRGATLSATKPVPDFDVNALMKDTPQNRLLFAISETLFDPDIHYISAHCVLADPSVERNYSAIADTLGMTGSALRKRVVHIRKALEEAVAFEDPRHGLKVPEALGRQHHAHKTKKYGEVNPALIDTDLPIAKKIYDTALQTGCSDNELFVFCATHLYRAPAKMSLEDIERKYGITVSTGNSYISNVKRRVRASLKKTDPDIANHPILRLREYTKSQPFKITQDEFDLRNARGTQELERLASTLFNFRQYYAFTRLELCIPAPGIQELADEMGVPKTIVRAAIENGRKTMLDAVHHSDISDEARNNPIVKRWIKNRQGHNIAIDTLEN